jgi:hypothetical protein
MHKNLNSDYTDDDFDFLGLIVSGFSDIILLPHILAEVSSLARQIKRPAKSHIQMKLREMVEITTEIPIPSLLGVRRDEFDVFGLTDAVILHSCATRFAELEITLLTADAKLANQANALGYSVLLYSDFFS